MKDDSASYFDSKEFTKLLASYENMLVEGCSVYFDSMDIANIAEYYSMNGELDKSDTAIEYGLRLHPTDADILISKANNLLRRGLKDEARVLTESISDPENQELLYLKGEIELAFDRPDQADVYFTQAVQLSDDDPGMLNDIIVKYMDNRNYELCQKWLDMALVLSPDSRNFIELQADLFFDTGQADTAIEWYNHLLDEFAYDTYYWDLVVGEEVVGLLAVLVRHQRHVRRIEHVSRSGRVERLPVAVLVHHENLAVVAPLAQVLHGGRPHHLVASAVGVYEVVVGAVDVDAVLARLVRVFKHIGLTVGNVFPEGHVGVTDCGEFQCRGRSILAARYHHHCCSHMLHNDDGIAEPRHRGISGRGKHR